MKDKKDALGDRMKSLEAQEASRKLIPLLPICVRLDGKGFSKFTKGLGRPFDKRLSDLMVETTKFLAEETNAKIAYTQSDEISLILYTDSYKEQLYFDGKIQKLVSVLSSICTAKFNQLLPLFLPDKKELAVFDCRVWNVPNKEEAANTLVWREIDATKNSVSMAAREYYSHKKLMNLRRAEMMDLLMEKKINWNDYPEFFKRGTYIQRKTTSTKFSAEELEKLPLKHEARKNPDLEIIRSKFVVSYPCLKKAKNKLAVCFEGADATYEN